MNISSTTMATPAKLSFQAEKPEIKEKPLYDIEGKADNEVVGYGNWGPNYPVPITAGQVRDQQASKLNTQAAQTTYKPQQEETPEEYYQRKINSTEWMM